MISTNDLMALLKVSRMTIERHKKKGMPFYRVGKLIRFKEDEVLDYFKKEGK